MTYSKKEPHMSFIDRNDMAQATYPVPPEQTYQALLTTVNQSKKFTLKSRNDQQMACLFTTGMSLFTWGEELTASVAADQNGSMVTVSVKPRAFGTVLGQRRQQAKEIRTVLDAVAQQLNLGTSQQ